MAWPSAVDDECEYDLVARSRTRTYFGLRSGNGGTVLLGHDRSGLTNDSVSYDRQ